MTGHMLGAAGGAEALFTVLALRDQVMPPTINLDNRMSNAIWITCRTPRVRRRSMWRYPTRFGFGGTNGTLAFRRFDG